MFFKIYINGFEVLIDTESKILELIIVEFDVKALKAKKNVLIYYIVFILLTNIVFEMFFGLLNIIKLMDFNIADLKIK